MTARRTAAAALAACSLVACWLPAAPARAHGTTDPRQAPVLDRVDPPLPAGVVVQVRTSVSPQLVAANPTATELAVLDASGREFLRLSARGVYADVANAAWWESLTPAAPAPTGSPAPAAADWRLVFRGMSWGWFDHRLHPLRGSVWSVPLRYGTRAASAHGRIEMRPLGNYVPRFAGELPAGVRGELLPGRVPGIFLGVSGTETVTILDESGRPFARLTATTTEVNVLSPTYLEDRRLRGVVRDVPPADANAAPRWQRAPGPTLTWLDRRLAFPPGPPPSERTEVPWTLNLLVGSRPVGLRGTTTWQPAAVPPAPVAARRSRAPVLPLALGLAVFAAGIAAVALRRRSG